MSTEQTLADLRAVREHLSLRVRCPVCAIGAIVPPMRVAAIFLALGGTARLLETMARHEYLALLDSTIARLAKE